MNIYEKIIKWVMHSLVFLVPLFFLPFSFEAFEFNKQYLIFFLVLLGVFAWLAKMIFIDKEIKFKKTPLDIPILAVLLIAILSAIFSVDKTSSFLGTYGRFSNGLIPVLVLGIFYFFITNNLVKLSGVIKSLVYSGSLVILLSYLSVLGILGKIKFLPIIMQQNFGSVSGSMEALAVFLASFISLLVGIILIQKFNSKKKALFYWLVFVLGLILLIIIDFSSAWIILVITTTALLGFSLAKRIFKDDVNKLLLPIFLLIISAVMFFVNLPASFLNSSIIPEIILSQNQSLSVSWHSVSDNAKNVFLGSGPGTFSIDFSKFKAVGFNQTGLWQYRFDRSGNNFAEILATNGFLGILAFLALVIMFFWVSIKSISAKISIQPVKVQGILPNQAQSALWPEFPLVITFVALIVAQFVFYQNTVLMFMFWLILGLSMISSQKNFGEIKYSFKEFPETGLLFGVALMVIAVGFLGLYFFGLRFYLADAAYLKAVNATNVSVQQKNLERAVVLNSYQIQYKIILSRFYLALALNEVAKPSDQQNTQTIQNNIAKAIDLARVVTENSPNNVAAWENRGLLYREIGNLVSGASEWGIKSFNTAIALEPTNPVFHTELGKLLLATNKEEAKKEFNKALELKSDYSEAVLQEVWLLEQAGDNEAAIKKLEAQAVATNYSDVEVLFQLGRFYYNKKQTDDAILVFKQIIALNPNHSNTHYALGVIYATRGDNKAALTEFKKVLELNPGNQDVQNKISELEK